MVYWKWLEPKLNRPKQGANHLISFTVEETAFLLELIRQTLPAKFGYSDNKAVAQLQGKLSVLNEVASSMGRHSVHRFPDLEDQRCQNQR